VKKNWKKPKSKKPKLREVSREQLDQILEQAAQGALGPEALETLHEAVETLCFLQQAIQAKSASIGRLRHLLFGPSTEKTQKVLGKAEAQSQGPKDSAAAPASRAHDPGSTQSGMPSPHGAERPVRKGHGRNGAEDYVGARRVQIPHDSLHHKDRCPGCETGKLYIQDDPRHLLRIVGMAPLSATVYELERLRCLSLR
jgi:transposase